MSEEEIKDTLIILEDTDISTIDNAENVDLRTYQLAVNNLLDLYNKEKDYAMGLYYDVQGLQQDLDKEKEKNKELKEKAKNTMGLIGANYIHKDKVKEKIEELEKLYKLNLNDSLTTHEMFYIVHDYILKIKNILQELL